MNRQLRKGSVLLTALGSLSVGVAAVSAQQTPAADAAAQTGGPLGLSWWLWIVLILLLLFLLWWLFLRRKPVPPPPPEPPRRSATYERPVPPAAPMTPAMPATPVAPPAPTYEPPTRAAMPEVPLMAEPEPAFMEPEPSFMEPDDLKRIEGIGPRIAGILNAAGITTFAALSLTSVERLREILVAAELRGSFGDPTTWPEQARLAAAGLWDDLQQMQDNLKGGR